VNQFLLRGLNISYLQRRRGHNGVCGKIDKKGLDQPFR